MAAQHVEEIVLEIEVLEERVAPQGIWEPEDD